MVVAVRKSSAKAALFKRAIALFGAAKQHCAVPRWIRTATADIPSISGKFCSFFKVFYVLVPSCTIFLTYSDLFKSVKNDMFLCRKNTDLRESIYTSTSQAIRTWPRCSVINPAVAPHQLRNPSRLKRSLAEYTASVTGGRYLGSVWVIPEVFMYNVGVLMGNVKYAGLSSSKLHRQGSKNQSKILICSFHPVFDIFCQSSKHKLWPGMLDRWGWCWLSDPLHTSQAMCACPLAIAKVPRVSLGTLPQSSCFLQVLCCFQPEEQQPPHLYCWCINRLTK